MKILVASDPRHSMRTCSLTDDTSAGECIFSLLYWVCTCTNGEEKTVSFASHLPVSFFFPPLPLPFLAQSSNPRNSPTMKLFGLFLLRVQSGSQAEPVICASAVDVSSVGFFQRSSAKEFLIFLARTVSKRVAPGSRNQVTEQGHNIYCHLRMDGLSAVAICDSEYNNRVAFSLLSQILTDFTEQFRGKWEHAEGQKDNYCAWPELDRTLVKYQSPEEADKILKIKKEIEETKIIMHQAIDNVLERGEKIDNLVARSEDLGGASKTFYKQAKKTNSSCCSVC